MGFFKVANQKARKTITIGNVRFAIGNVRKFTASFSLIYSRHLTVLGSCYCEKNKLTSVFYASALLLMINFVITLSKFTAEPLACGTVTVF